MNIITTLISQTLLFTLLRFLPLFFFFRDRRTLTNNERLLWMFAIIFGSWIAWALYLRLTPIFKQR